MNSEHQIEMNASLIAKYLAGEATPEEAFVVDEWQRDAVNKKQFDEIVKIWDMLPESKRHVVPDTKIEWKQIQNLHTKKNQRLYKFFYNRYALAASILAV